MWLNKNIVSSLFLAVIFISLNGCVVESEDDNTLNTAHQYFDKVYTYSLITKEIKLIQDIPQQSSREYYEQINSMVNAGTQVNLFNIDTGEIRSVGQGNMIMFHDVSRDGKFVVFMPFEVNKKEVFKVNIDGSNQTKLCNGIRPRFSEDGKKICFWDYSDANNKSWIGVYDIATNTSRVLYEATKPKSLFSPEFTSDSKYLIFSESTQNTTTSIAVLRKISVENPSDNKVVFNPGDYWFQSFDVVPNSESIVLEYYPRDNISGTTKYYIYQLNYNTGIVDTMGMGNYPHVTYDGNEIVYKKYGSIDTYIIQNRLSKSIVEVTIPQTEFRIGTPYLTKDKTRFVFSASKDYL